MKKIWVTVIVESGIPTEIEVFNNYSDAKKYKSKGETELNLEDDSIEIFEKEMNN